jgi:hypothetical protein
MPDPNQVSADFEHGVLQIRMKRHAEQERSRRIEVRTGDPKGQQSLSQSSGQDPMTSTGSTLGSDGAGQSGAGQNGSGQGSSSSASMPSGG